MSGSQCPAATMPAPEPVFIMPQMSRRARRELAATIDALNRQLVEALQIPADILFGGTPRGATSSAADRDALREFQDRVAPRRRGAT